MTSGEQDFTKRVKSKTDHWWIKGVELKDPTNIECLPCSIENDALAYDEVNDRFKVIIEAITASITNDVTDRAARLLGVIYGSQAQQLLQRATTYDLLVQLRHNGAEINPQTIRALTSSDIITAYGSLDALQQRATTKDLIVQIQHQGVEKDPTQIRALTNSDVVTVEQATAASLKATVTQAEKDRTVTDISYVGTVKQIDNTFAAAGNYTVWDPAADKKVRIKLISLELSADVDLGFRFGAAGTIYYLRTTAGPIVTNFIGANVEGAADELFILNASAACTVKGYVIGEEV